MKSVFEYSKDELATENGEDGYGKYKIPYKINKYWRVYEDGKIFSTSKKDFIKETRLCCGIKTIIVTPKNRKLRVHYLVALLYLSRPKNKEEKYVIFKDKNPENTHYTNLMYHTDTIILDENYAVLKDRPDYVAHKDGTIYSKKEGVLQPIKPQEIITKYHKIFNGLSVHRLVHSAFYPDVDISGLEIDHINRIKNDNSVENLRPATSVEQVQNMKKREYTPKPIVKCTIDGDILEFYDNINDAIANNNINLSEMRFRGIIKNKENYGGYMWAYKNRHYKPKDGELCKEMIYNEFGENINFPGHFIYSSGVIVRVDEKKYYVFYPFYNEKYPYVKIILKESDTHEDDSKKFVIHRRLAIFFVSGRTEEKNQVHHKDENKNNFSLENLEWVTARENVIATVGKPVKQIDPNTDEVLAVFPSISEAERANPCIPKIWECCNGKRNTSGGFKWEKCTKEEMEIFIKNNSGKNSKNIDRSQFSSSKEKFVKQINLKNEDVISIFKSAAAAVRSGLGSTKISSCCRGERNKAGNFNWKYCTEEETKLFKEYFIKNPASERLILVGNLKT